MKFLENIFKKAKPFFENSGRLRKLWPLLDASETFLYRLPTRTSAGAHIRDAFDVKRMMMTVVISLIPPAIFGMYNIGYQHFHSGGINAGTSACIYVGASVLAPLYLVTFITGGLWEAIFAVIRKHELSEGFLVTGMLIPLILPPTIPLWQVAAATSFGVIFGKEFFGGVGMNIFNPALVTRAFLFFAYPRSISGNSVWILAGKSTADTYTMASPLALSAEAGGSIVEFLHSGGYTFIKMFIGLIPGSIGETSVPAILLGAVILIATGVGSWRIMLSVFAGGIIMSSLFILLSPSQSNIMALPPHYHLIMGGFAFGAVFMATDPVSGASTNIGKYIYGFFIGLLAIMVRTLNPAYPEGMMLSILFMNLFAPLIDYGVIRTNMRRRMRHAAE